MKKTIHIFAAIAFIVFLTSSILFIQRTGPDDGARYYETKISEATERANANLEFSRGNPDPYQSSKYAAAAKSDIKEAEEYEKIRLIRADTRRIMVKISGGIMVFSIACCLASCAVILARNKSLDCRNKATPC